MITVVHFIHGLNMGGAETLVKNYALMLDKSKFKVIVLCYVRNSSSPYEDLLNQNGIQVIFVCDKMPLYEKNNMLAKLINRTQRYLFIRKELKKLPRILFTVRRHIVGGTSRTLISANLPSRSCRIGTCRRFSAACPQIVVALFERQLRCF